MSNINPLIYLVLDKPLMGTLGYKTLLKWLGEMDLDITKVRFHYIDKKPFDGYMGLVTLNKAVALNQIRVLSLSDNAREYLDKVGVKDFYVMPNPMDVQAHEVKDFKMMKILTKDCKAYVFKEITDEEDNQADDKGEAPAKQSSEG